MAALAQTARSLAPVPATTLELMADKDTSADAPLVVRTFKKEAELEVWKRNTRGRYVYIKTYPICRWSGQLGPSGTRATGRRQRAFTRSGPAR